MNFDDNSEPTLRELEVISLLCQGCDNKEAASCLGIALRTVEHHLETAYQKLNAHGRVEAVVKALKAGWLTLEDNSNN